MNMKEFLDGHNLAVSKIVWTHIGDTKLDTPTVLYDENDKDNITRFATVDDKHTISKEDKNE